MSATPVGHLYTPQQLMGSVKYGSGVLLGNWREDDALDEMRMMDYIQAKEGRSLTLLTRQAKMAPQKAPATLSPAHSDGAMRLGDVIQMQSMANEGTLAVSLGQKLISAGTDVQMIGVFGSDPSAGAMARNTLTVCSFDGGAPGSVVCYGQRVVLQFSEQLGVRGCLSSMRAGRTQLSTQLINKQEVYMQVLANDGSAFPYDCAWRIQPENVDDRIVSQGTPVAAAANFVLIHCFTNQRLAGVYVTLPTDFGDEAAVCAHTYTDASKVNKLKRESTGRPSSNLISRSETTENLWRAVYA